MSDTNSPGLDNTSAGQVDDSLPIIEGILGGAGAYIVGYVITFLWKGEEYQNTFAQVQPLVELFGGETPAAWKIIGWLFYSAHFVESQITAGPVSAYIDLVAQGEGNLEILYFVPILLLIGAGYLVARRSREPRTIASGARAGGLVVISYFTLVLVGVFTFQVNGSGPELLPSIVLAGLVYPLVFGVVGGTIGSYIHS